MTTSLRVASASSVPTSVSPAASARARVSSLRPSDAHSDLVTVADERGADRRAHRSGMEQTDDAPH